SIAHAYMLSGIGLLSEQENKNIRNELIRLYHKAKRGEFQIEQGIEDVHSQVELILTQRLGETGKKIHTARSRNDQVLLDLKLFIRDEIKKMVICTTSLFSTLINQSNRYKEYLMPGYTHLQVAMPSSFGLWFAAFAESLADDMKIMLAAFQIANQNPLGSAAGFGSSFPVNRRLTTELLGFEDLNYNVMYAQMSRGKTERIVAFAIASLACTVSKIANDVCLFTSQNFGFLELPDEITTGSSIMPHKKNPDVFEILRARCNKLQALPNEIEHITGNLPSGYFRDYQVIKESFLPAFSLMKTCLEIADHMIAKLLPVMDIMKKDLYRYAFSVEEVNKLVLQGTPFREAYQKVAKQIIEGNFKPEHAVHHTHEGSIGNLSNDKITSKMKEVVEKFNFDRVESACRKLLEH
ncbi:MAG: argininosuccinate lyase, partial [Bacteroidales bacterium]|nr:argininosuccinate lyase [Bacteroidales bacterium]